MNADILSHISRHFLIAAHVDKHIIIATAVICVIRHVGKNIGEESGAGRLALWLCAFDSTTSSPQPPRATSHKTQNTFADMSSSSCQKERMGSTKHYTSTTAAATTALPKWDAQTTEDRFTSLRSSLQFALVDSSTSLLPNNNSSSSNAIESSKRGRISTKSSIGIIYYHTLLSLSRTTLHFFIFYTSIHSVTLPTEKYSEL